MRFVLLALVIGLAAPAPAPAPPAYTEEEYTRILYNGKVILSLGVDPDKHIPNNDDFADFEFCGIEAQGDFDRDGVPDAIVQVNLGGNACPGVSYVAMSGGRFGAPFLRCTGESVRVDPKGDHDELVVREWTKGENKTTTRFRFEKGIMKRVR